ncbi:MAG: hypothetical protein JXR63_02270 [Spirochaetales bacterium]|nr:hypothetical protein [Spirochaetales bacterium]
MKKKIFVVLIFLLNWAIFADSKEFLSLADGYNKSKDFENALKYYLLAADSSDDGFYSARLGQFYYFSLKDYQKAVEAFAVGYEKGFRRRGWLYVQCGNSYKFLGNRDKALYWFELGIANISETSRTELSQNRELLSLYANYCGALTYFRDFLAADEVGKAGLAIFSETDDYGFLNSYVRNLHWLSMEFFTGEKWGLAVETIKMAMELSVRNPDLKKRFYSEYELLSRVYINRARLGEITPIQRYRMDILIISETDAVDEAGKKVISSKVLDVEKEMTALSAGFVKRFIESGTNGQVTIDYKIEEVDFVLKKVAPSGKYWIPDLDFLLAENQAFFASSIASVDSYVLIWSAKEFNQANGGQRRFILPESGISVIRGYAHVTSERMNINGPDLLLHEFFHTVEKIFSISPLHGYYEENRSAFPDWKGLNGNDYYFWHFQESIPAYLKKKGRDYRDFNFISRYPVN